MRGFFSLLLGLCALPFAMPSAAQPVPLEKPRGYWDDHQCFHFEATAKMKVPVNELFDALARPEKLSAYGPGGGSPVRVFVEAQMTKESMWQNRWMLSNPPWAKIIEWEAIHDSSELTGFWWMEYEYNRYSHTIVEHSLGSSRRPSTCQPYSEAKYVLSARDGGSGTSVQYTSTECIPPEQPRRPYMEQSAKQSLGEWLEVAAADALAVAKERAQKPPSPSSSATPPPGLSSATATPAMSTSGTSP